MVNRRISSDMKKCALDLWNRGWTVEDIYDTLRVSRASLYRWDAIYEEHGNVIRPPYQPLMSDCSYNYLRFFPVPHLFNCVLNAVNYRYSP